ncbi:MAG: hypothetical protein M3004_09355 [Bacteroidota bacterium]|nr:hypothetical protein [Bacteroidota bacterium]
MKHIITLIAVTIFCTCTFAQQVGSKVSFNASDGKTYTGSVTEIKDDKYKIKYDGFEFEAWLLASQFTVIEPANQPAQPTLPAQPNTPTTIPENPQQQPQQTAPQQQMDPNVAGNMPANGAQTTTATGMTRSDSLKMALNNMKSAFNNINKLFAGKRDTMTIIIPEIDYDNTSLNQLKETIKKVKGVRSVVMHYNASTATMEVAYKGKPTDVWDNVSADVKTKFKLVEAGDNNITLKYKEKIP